jgi:hypothetical protein
VVREGRKEDGHVITNKIVCKEAVVGGPGGTERSYTHCLACL